MLTSAQKQAVVYDLDRKAERARADHLAARLHGAANDRAKLERQVGELEERLAQAGAKMIEETPTPGINQVHVQALALAKETSPHASPDGLLAMADFLLAFPSETGGQE